MSALSAINHVAPLASHLSEAARERMLSRRGEPLFLAAWRRVLMMHFEVDAGALQRAVPFQLDLYEGRAFVSLVAFSMEEMRPRLGGRWAARFFKPIATHDFLNVRTYVIHESEPGIHFMAEWLTNRLAVMLGPATFGLPYRYGRIAYVFDETQGELRGRVVGTNEGAELVFGGNVIGPAECTPAEMGSPTAWLMERYTAFNAAGGYRRFFRVWHPSWPQCPADVEFHDRNLLIQQWPWFEGAHCVGANYSPGFDEVWMGRPHGCVRR